MPRATLTNVLILAALSVCISLAASTNASAEDTELHVPTGGKTGFTRLGPETGIDFVNRLSTNRYVTNSNILNGSGVALGDVDGDGRSDIFFSSLENPSTLYRNLGAWRFTNITTVSGLGPVANLPATGATFADLDGDGDLDLLVNTFGAGTHIFENDGRGIFRERAVLNGKSAGMSLALADTDGDGDLDLYIANYRVATIRDEPDGKVQGEYVNGKPTVKSYNGVPANSPALFGRLTFGPDGKVLEHGEPDAFYRNDGGFKFTQIAFDSGAFRNEEGKPIESIPRDWGLSCVFRDINGDMAPDLYVCNDFESPDRLWLNDGTGNFHAAPALALRHTCRFSMGIDFADIDRDGKDDFFVADMMSRHHTQRNTRDGIPPYLHQVHEVSNRPQYSENMLYRNRGDDTYEEVGCFSGVAATEWTWSAAFLDVDLDGWEDLLVTNGNELDSMHGDVINRADEMKKQRQMSRMELLALRFMFKRLNTPNLAFRNNRDRTFSEVSHQWGFDEAAVSHGMAFADLDGDGDLDVVINNLNGPASIYRNDSSAPRVAVRLKGAAPNTQGIGAKIRFTGGPVEQSQQMISGGRYLSGDQALRVFAAGTNPTRGEIEVTWRNGTITRVADVKPNRLYEISEADAQSAKPTPKPPDDPWFEDVSNLLNHTHAEEPFEDFQRQPLLPYRLSQLGPGISWHDFDQDGWDDLIIPTGRSGKLALFRNDQHGHFTPIAEPFVQRTVSRDQTTALGIGPLLLVGSANYEDGTTNGGWIRVLDMTRKASGENLLGPEASAGPMALADVDGDGRLDLFIGGRAIGGKYPLPATSILFHNEGNRFVPKQRFEKLGLVSGAVFSDLDGDGDQDLILACHWGPVRVFRNDKGIFTEATEQLGLSPFKGLWNGVATADLDNDGRPDLIVSNWGLNTRWKASPERPLKLYYGDLDGNGVIDMVEAHYDDELHKEVPLRILKSVGPAIPFVQEKMRTFEAYGNASVQEIYGDALAKAGLLEVTTLRSMVFLNRGTKFEAHPLPTEVQFTPAFGIAVGDLDGDGNEDLLLSQNFFATNPEMPRSDAGRGLLLRGDGKGNLTPVPGQISGIKVYGEQRGCALADYDQDGRLDLVLTQNGAATKLYRNKKAPPGARVVIRGTPLNPAGIGTRIRIQRPDGTSTLREVQAGSGYWSANSPTQIIYGPGELVIQLPWGKEVNTAIPKPGQTLIVSADGNTETK